jgi:N-acetylglucosaminyldiphosphoundecaprenol N-acetyl-beta-D-mannosaminyltransferase
LMLDLCRSSATKGHRIFLYGGAPAVLTALEASLVKRFPDLRVTGRYSPPFRPLSEEEDRQIVALIQASEADLIFVGLGTPKQERWMHDHRHSLPGLTMIGVGAAFDFHAGHTPQAPPWIQRSGLEWLFRLIVEPARLWRRYVLITPRFLPLWLVQLLKTFRESRS